MGKQDLEGGVLGLQGRGILSLVLSYLRRLIVLMYICSPTVVCTGVPRPGRRGPWPSRARNFEFGTTYLRRLIVLMYICSPTVVCTCVLMYVRTYINMFC